MGKNISVTAIGVRAQPEWREWVHRLAHHGRHPTLPELIDAALVAYARGLKFGEAPPPRLPAGATRKKNREKSPTSC